MTDAEWRPFLRRPDSTPRTRCRATPRSRGCRPPGSLRQIRDDLQAATPEPAMGNKNRRRRHETLSANGIGDSGEVRGEVSIGARSCPSRMSRESREDEYNSAQIRASARGLRPEPPRDRPRGRGSNRFAPAGGGRRENSPTDVEHANSTTAKRDPRDRDLVSASSAEE